MPQPTCQAMTISSWAEEVYRVVWVVEGVLARSHRPGYPKNRPPLDTVHKWTDEVLSMGVRSAICVLDCKQLSQYDALNLDGGGLLEYYRTLGLNVVHVPAEDYKTPPLSPSQLERVWEAFGSLDKPVLVHCSAGRDRTGAAVEHILSKMERQGA